MKNFFYTFSVTLLITLTLSAAEKPNFLVIYFDDTGWTDFSCYGGVVPTPHIDGLAKDGMRFTDFYSPAPNCSPSRVGLLTGRTPSRVGMYSYIPPNHVMHLPDDEVTVAELLQGAGYATGTFGKWHLSQLMTGQPQPDDQGFDYYLSTDNNAAKADPDNFVRNGEPAGKIKGSACHIVVDEANAWIEKNSDQPFFAYVAFHETHSPIGAPDELVKHWQKIEPNKKRAAYLAMVANADLAVGRLLKKIDELGLRDNTFVLLASDNGPTSPLSRGPLREKKSFVYEGGIRVPGIVRWPGRVQPGTVSDEPAGLIDFLPTVCSITGIAPPANRAIDGADMTPAFTGRPIVRRTPLFWFFYRNVPAAAMRVGDWVVLADLDRDSNEKFSHAMVRIDMTTIKGSGLKDFELYHLKNDLGQEQDLAKLEPERLRSMSAQLVGLHRQVINDGPWWDIPADYGKKKN
ncbi:MAG: sulfatase [Planctomycetota bacterium]|jgi:arylsulfatase A